MAWFRQMDSELVMNLFAFMTPMDSNRLCVRWELCSIMHFTYYGIAHHIDDWTAFFHFLQHFNVEEKYWTLENMWKRHWPAQIHHKFWHIFGAFNNYWIKPKPNRSSHFKVTFCKSLDHKCNSLIWMSGRFIGCVESVHTWRNLLKIHMFSFWIQIQLK